MRDANVSAGSYPLSLVNVPTRSELEKKILAHFRDGSGFSLATLNLDHIVKMRQSPDFLEAYEAQTYVVADGNPIVWLSRLAGRSIELLPGSELIEPLAQLAAENNAPIAMLGATQEALDLAARRLERANPGLVVCAKIAPPFGFDPNGADAATCLSEINASGAQICFLALGAPKQEILAARGAELAPNCGFISIGAGLDFIAGSQTRAPVWVRKLALEWVWRLLSNPGRLAGRYARCIAILPGLTWAALKSRHRR